MAEVVQGVVLNDLVNGVEDDILTSKREDVRRVIRAIFGDMARWEGEIVIKQREIDGLRGKVAGARDKINKLRAEDWSALPQLKQEKSGGEQQKEGGS